MIQRGDHWMECLYFFCWMIPHNFARLSLVSHLFSSQYEYSTSYNFMYLYTLHIGPNWRGMQVLGEGSSGYIFSLRRYSQTWDVTQKHFIARFKVLIDLCNNFERFPLKCSNLVSFWATKTGFMSKWGRMSPEIHLTNNMWPIPGNLSQTPALLVKSHVSNRTPTCWPRVQWLVNKWKN